MMSQTITHAKGTSYTLAGTQLRPFERIVVASSVAIPDSFYVEEDQRKSFRAPGKQRTRTLALSLPWALLLIVLTIGIMAKTSLQRVQQSDALRDEFAQLQNKYEASERERVDIEARISDALDGSFISYYAVQKLGMTLAINEETIQLLAPSTRPAIQLGQNVLIGNVGGQ
jgi:cell division protein FtsB